MGIIAQSKGSAEPAQSILDRLKAVDGTGSGLDADTVDGKHASELEPAFNKNSAFNKNFGSTAGTVCQGNDSRLSNARTPTSHASTHVTGGSDVIANAIANGNAGLMSGEDKAKLDGVESGAQVNTVASVAGKTGAVALVPSDVGAEPAFTKNTAFNKNFGTAAGTVCQGNDARLSDARTPVSHSHTPSEVGLGNVSNDAQVKKAGDTMTGDLVVQGIVKTDELRCQTGQQLVLNVGESSGQATSQTGEALYINAEQGLEINSSPDNWASGWAARKTAQICKPDGSTILPGELTIGGKLTTPAATESQASLNLPHGIAPTSPIDGDLWTTTGGIYSRINGYTRNIYHSGNVLQVSQTEAEAGTATTNRLWTAQRVAQAITALSPVNSVAGKTGAVTLEPSDVGAVSKSGDSMTGALGMAQVYFNSQIDAGNSGTGKTINWTSGNKQRVTMTGTCTFAFTAPAGPTNLLLLVQQDATGNRQANWPASVKWAGGVKPNLSAAANAVDIIGFYFDGTTYYASLSPNFA